MELKITLNEEQGMYMTSKCLPTSNLLLTKGEVNLERGSLADLDLTKWSQS